MTDPTPTDRAPEQSDQLQEQLEHAASTCPLGYIVVKESDFNAAHAAQESAQATIESLEKFRDHYQEESDAGLATISELTRRNEELSAEEEDALFRAAAVLPDGYEIVSSASLESTRAENEQLKQMLVASGSIRLQAEAQLQRLEPVVEAARGLWHITPHGFVFEPGIKAIAALDEALAALDATQEKL